MDIRDLSIGDWVTYDRDTTPVQIVGLYQRNNQDCVVMSDSYYSEGVIGFVERLKPIPITPEILEKNGYVKNGEYNEWNIGTWKTPYLLGVSLERLAVTIKWSGSSIFIDRAKYVHQLQHAFRLAGIEKEIKL